MDTKRMLKDGFKKKQVAIMKRRDRNGKEHIVVVDTIEHAKEYGGFESIHQATMFVKE